MAVLIVLTSSCNSQASRSEALDNAEPEVRARVQEYQTAASGLLQSPGTVASIERALADGNPAVFDSRSAKGRVTWSWSVKAPAAAAASASSPKEYGPASG